MILRLTTIKYGFWEEQITSKEEDMFRESIYLGK